MSTRVLIVGAGGQGRVVADILLAAGTGADLVPVGFVDDRADLCGSMVLGIAVLGTLAQLTDIPHDAVVVAIGENRRRQRVFLELEGRGERLVTVRHPFTNLAHDVIVGPGCMISAGVVVTPCVRIGRGVILNTSSCVDHESVVGDFAHVSVGAAVGANAVIGARTLVGLGAAVMSDRRIGADCLVGAGALVADDLPDNVVAVGVPARVRRQHI